MFQPVAPSRPAWETDRNVPIPYVGVPPGYVPRVRPPVSKVKQIVKPIYHQRTVPIPLPQVVPIPSRIIQPIQPFQQVQQKPIFTSDGSPVRVVILVRFQH